jgi:hypothetical protein
VPSDSLHEASDALTTETIDLHRAIRSLMEELEAVDWYQQRVDATPDKELAAVLAHNRDEEIEHALMTLEWIRRRNATFDEACRMFLFSEGPITEVEHAFKTAAAGASNATAPPGAKPTAAAAKAPTDGSLGIGSLKLA